MTDKAATPERRLCSPGAVTAIAAAGLLALTLLRLLVAATTPLSADEAYYWTWSRALALGYLDHPPMVALWIRAGTALAGDTALGVRLLAPLAAAAGTLLLFDAARILHPGRALPAAVLLNATLMLGAGAVTLTPDTPLLFFWTAAAWALARLAAGAEGRAGTLCWLAAGLAAGLAFDSKYTAAFLAPAAILLMLLPGRRHWWRHPAPWAAAVLAVAATSPVLLWNSRHGWASLLKQGGRVSDWHPGFRFELELLGGQLGLATPWVFALFCWGLAAALRRWRTPRHVFPALLVLPGALVFVQHAVGDRVQANWLAVLYPGAALAAAALPGRAWRPAALLGFVLTALVYVQATLAPIPLPRGADPTLRLAGWDTLAKDLAATARQDGATFLASEEYGAASLLAWHGPGLPVLAAESRWALVDLPRAAPATPGLLLLSDRRREPPDPATWQSAEPLGTVVRGRAGLEAERYRLYRVVPRPGAFLTRLPDPPA